jgi:hypothetical protein
VSNIKANVWFIHVKLTMISYFGISLKVWLILETGLFRVLLRQVYSGFCLDRFILTCINQTFALILDTKVGSKEV